MGGGDQKKATAASCAFNQHKVSLCSLYSSFDVVDRHMIPLHPSPTPTPTPLLQDDDTMLTKLGCPHEAGAKGTAHSGLSSECAEHCVSNECVVDAGISKSATGKKESVAASLPSRVSASACSDEGKGNCVTKVRGD